MSKKLLILLGVIVIILVILLGIILAFTHSTSTSSSTTPGSTATFPVSTTVAPNNSGSTTAKPITVAAADGGNPIQVKDFKNESGVIQNAYGNQGYDLLVGTTNPAAPTPAYEIDYSDKDQSFGITLNKEPLGTYRKQAEQDLMQHLGITAAQMCDLNYFVGVANGVNDAYNGQNLGFSFCPGAVVLPG